MENLIAQTEIHEFTPRNLLLVRASYMSGCSVPKTKTDQEVVPEKDKNGTGTYPLPQHLVLRQVRVRSQEVIRNNSWPRSILF